MIFVLVPSFCKVVVIADDTDMHIFYLGFVKSNRYFLVFHVLSSLYLDSYLLCIEEREEEFGLNGERCLQKSESWTAVPGILPVSYNNKLLRKPRKPDDFRKILYKEIFGWQH